MSRFEMDAYVRPGLVAVRGEGARLFDAEGTAYLDLYGGHAVSLLGNSPPRVCDALANQARDLLFTSNLFHVPVRARAAEKLARLAPWDDTRVFFVNSGTEAVETALKIARKKTGRRRVAAFDGGFHGRTLGALAACGLGSYREMAAGLVEGYDLLPFNDLAALESIGETCAAVLVEPVQSMGGMRTLGGEFARALRRRCDEAGALLIFDEIQTAPARTGTWFAGEHWDVAPDVIVTAKGVAGGFPAGAVLARGAIAASVRPGDQGTTFGGGPLACAAIEATLDELVEIDGPARARSIEQRMRAAFDMLGLGALLGIRVDGEAKETVRTLRERHHVLVGGCPGDPRVIRLFPPLVITDDELDEGIEALRSVVQ